MIRIQKSVSTGIRLTFLLILLTNAVACNGKKQLAKNATATPVPTEVSSSGVDTSGSIIITFAGYEFERQLYEPLMAEFHQQNLDITVQFVALPEYSDQTKDLFTDYPRLLSTTADTSIVYSSGGKSTAYFRDLTPLIETDPTFNPTDFWPATSNACQDADGNVLGEPVSMQIQGIFFDRQAFDAANLPYPAPGWTWDDFRKDVTTLAKQEGDSIRYGYAERSATIMMPFIEAALEDNGGQVSSDKIQPLVQWYLDMVAAHAIRPAPDYDNAQYHDDWENLFQSANRPAMWGGSLGEILPGGNSEKLAYQEYGFAPYPVTATGSQERGTPVTVQCATISSGSPNPHAAWQWVEFLTHRWLVLTKTGSLAITTVPARISVSQSADYWKILPNEVQTTAHYILEQGGYALGSDADTTYTVAKAVAKAASGETNLADALQVVDGQPSPSTSGAGTPVVVATPIPTPAADATIVNYYLCTLCGDSTGVEKLVEQYNQSHPEVTIKLSTDFDYGEDMQSVSNAFDCATARPVRASEQLEDYFIDLSPLFDAEDTAFRQDFDPALLNTFRRDGKLVGLPAVSQPMIMVYNADLLAKRGIQPPGLDWTFGTFIMLASQAASSTQGDQSYGTIFNIYDDFLFDGRGVVWVDATTDPPTPRFDSPEVASALAWMDSLIKSGVLLVMTGGESGLYNIIDNLTSGKVAFWQTSMGHLSESVGWMDASSQPPKYAIGILPIPLTSRVSSSSFGNFISNQSKSPQVCWNWIKYLSGQPTLMDGVPARSSVANSPEWEAIVGKKNAKIYRLALKQAIQNTQERQPYNYLLNPFEVWETRIITAVTNGEDYRTMLPLTQAMAESYLACMSSVDQSKLTDSEMNDAATNCAQKVDPEYK